MRDSKKEGNRVSQKEIMFHKQESASKNRV